MRYKYTTHDTTVQRQTNVGHTRTGGESDRVHSSQDRFNIPKQAKKKTSYYGGNTTTTTVLVSNFSFYSSSSLTGNQTNKQTNLLKIVDSKHCATATASKHINAFIAIIVIVKATVKTMSKRDRTLSF